MAIWLLLCTKTFYSDGEAIPCARCGATVGQSVLARQSPPSQRRADVLSVTGDPDRGTDTMAKGHTSPPPLVICGQYFLAVQPPKGGGG